jgi:DNA primase
MSLSPQFLDELRARTLLSALVGRSVKLTKAGREHKGCCPFHNEKTPSFYVNDEKGFYHCFGCSTHGDAIRWMTDQRGLPFMDAVKELAEAAGMEVPAPDPRAADRAEKANSLYDVMTAAANWFTEQLGGIEGAGARAYLEKRGLTAETIRTFGLGYAPDSRGKLKAALSQFGEDKLIEAGLLIQVESKDSYDRFRGRLMIPIRDPRGRVIAFGGRILGAGEPKYLNSPDTPLFDKGHTLYNLDLAAAATRDAKRIIVVEGYMDVIAMAQAGIREVVAPLGTAVTEFQLERLWRYSNVPILCLDGDAAGQKAAIRAAHRALPLLKPGYSLDFVTLPEGQDPADMIQAGAAAALIAYLASNVRTTLSQLVWQAEVSTGPKTPEERAGLRDRLDHLAQSISNSLVSQEYRSLFKDLFWETFGWGRKNAVAVSQASMRARAAPKASLNDAIVKATLLGLSRFTSVLREEYELVTMLHIENQNLEAWRNILIQAFNERPDLDEALIDTILECSEVDPIEKRDLTRDLAFSFFHLSDGRGKQESDLRQVIATLVAERNIEIALAQASERFKAATDSHEYVEQQEWLRQRQDVRERLRDFQEAAEEQAQNHLKKTG